MGVKRPASFSGFASTFAHLVLLRPQLMWTCQTIVVVGQARIERKEGSSRLRFGRLAKMEPLAGGHGVDESRWLCALQTLSRGLLLWLVWNTPSPGGGDLFIVQRWQQPHVWRSLILASGRPSSSTPARASKVGKTPPPAFLMANLLRQRRAPGRTLISCHCLLWLGMVLVAFHRGRGR